MRKQRIAGRVIVLSGTLGLALLISSAAMAGSPAPVTWTDAGGAESKLYLQPLDGTLILSYASSGQTTERPAQAILASPSSGAQTRLQAYANLEQLLATLGFNTPWIFREEGSTDAAAKLGSVHLQNGIGAVKVPAVVYEGAVYAAATELFRALDLQAAVAVSDAAGIARFDVQVW